MTLRVVSYGGGVQSTALLVLAARREIDFPVFLFSNVGDDSEHPATLQYVRDVAMPYAKVNGIDLIELHRQRRDGTTETLMQHLERSNSSISIPVRMANGAPGNRNCTEDFKIRVVGKWLKANGATAANPATVGLGISMDEIQRMRTDDPRQPWQHKTYPLIDLRLSRQDCINIIADADLPVPPKSSCFFCPFKRIADWQRMRANEPELFERSVVLEQMINRRRTRLGKDDVYLTAKAQPLDQAIGSQAVMDFEDTCESGYCMT